MESIGVLMTCPMSPYLEQELEKRFNFLRLWKFPENQKSHYLKLHSDVGLDKIDLELCREKGIKVTYCPDLITDDVADTGIALILAV
ncbi:hypothetical protein RND71_017142 [Anisodus tanguticus]|uniref:D-isomer specific 2-hydroxyacid dehydrogenase catalytic domain-containing protein n=1 Tax=Anisodus tanguticus TaxID=243964 RepID=A0AAE1VFR3_9SOLA|nr:hypothetical protein RND71_017142 [Anisodus tanguticus]